MFICTGAGYVGRSPKIVHVNGKKYIDFPVCVNSENATLDGHPQWIVCRKRYTPSGFMEKHIRQGARVLFSGTISLEVYFDSTQQKNMVGVLVWINTIEMLMYKDESDVVAKYRHQMKLNNESYQYAEKQYFETRTHLSPFQEQQPVVPNDDMEDKSRLKAEKNKAIETSEKKKENLGAIPF